MRPTYWVYDYETIIDCFVAVFTDYNLKEQYIFTINGHNNDLDKLVSFYERNINNKDKHLGFNCLDFDSQITEYIIQHKDRLKYLSSLEIAKKIYDYAQVVINKRRNKEWYDYPEYKLTIPVVDIFKINHWDNINKRTSLKWAQFGIDWYNLQEMPYHHSEPLETIEKIKETVDYCINDVLSTRELFKRGLKEIELRKSLATKYNINCINYSNTKIGSELLLKLYCEKTGKNTKDVKEMRTYRSSIPIEDILFPYISFKTNIFNDFLTKIRNVTIYNTKNDFTYNIDFNGNHFAYGAGGLHQCIKPGIYVTNDEYIINDADVASKYPSIAIQNKMYPAHLGVEFYDVYKNDLVDVRLAEKAKKELGDKAIIDGFKEAANASYGKSNSTYSWLYDPKYTMQTTINGQLMITMIIEELLISLTNAQLLQTNTDGFTLRYKKSEQHIYDDICNKWQKLTGLVLEYAIYKKMIIADVNSYIGVYESGKTKCKGRFEHENILLHKNKSMLVIPKAIYEYFINGISPELYIQTNKNIFDYCACGRLKEDWFFVERGVENSQYFENKLQKIVRYYVSIQGNKLVKCNPDGREIQLESGPHLTTVYNKHQEKDFQDYKINFDYYLTKIKEELEKIESNVSYLTEPIQLTLF